MRQFPVCTIDIDNSADLARLNKMTTLVLVDVMIELHNSLSAAYIPTEKKILKRQIETTNKQIDNLVYELFGLTEEEMQILEESPDT